MRTHDRERYDPAPSRAMPEDVLEPELPIVDPHHHLWDRPPALLRAMPPSEHGFADILSTIARYLFDEFLRDVASGHNVRASVYMECGSMYRSGGPDPFKSVGEVEFVNGIAAQRDVRCDPRLRGDRRPRGPADG
jgi:L-fuconolactonase